MNYIETYYMEKNISVCSRCYEIVHDCDLMYDDYTNTLKHDHCDSLYDKYENVKRCYAFHNYNGVMLELLPNIHI